MTAYWVPPGVMLCTYTSCMKPGSVAASFPSGLMSVRGAGHALHPAGASTWVRVPIRPGWSRSQRASELPVAVTRWSSSPRNWTAVVRPAPGRLSWSVLADVPREVPDT